MTFIVALRRPLFLRVVEISQPCPVVQPGPFARTEATGGALTGQGLFEKVAGAPRESVRWTANILREK
jgi:hypothetical protein